MTDPQVRTDFIRHEWDFPVTGSVQEINPRTLRLVAWAKCARCLRLVASNVDIERPLVMSPGEAAHMDMGPLLKSLGHRLSFSPCPGKPDQPPAPPPPE